jgi:cyclophilin family peptidyl-prolyl cis-trans isomerase
VRSAGTLLLAVALLAVLAGCGGSDDTTTEPFATTTEETTETGTETATGSAQKGECREVDAPAAREDGGETAPTERLDPEKTYTLTFATSCGSFTVTLDQAQSPATAASLVSLARAGFFDDTTFHRIVPGFVIQGGDPTQTGTGGPGYSTRDVPPADASYVEGVVAMAKTETEPPGTGGSQFFVVTGEDIGLPAEYAIVGTVTDGIDVVRRIGLLGDQASQLPTQPVVIERVTAAEQ